MQTDEDVGKIALAVPVLVSKALELFLQDLCDRTYEITLQRGAKTMNALHLKHCVQSYNVFDFLRDIVSRVPDYGHGHSEAGVDDRALSKRRKAAAGDDCNDSDEEAKRIKMLELGHTGSTGRGRGRGRGRGHGRGARTIERETHHQQVESEPFTFVQPNSKDVPNTSMAIDNGPESKELSKENIPVPEENTQSLHNIDLNANLNENEDKNSCAAAQASLSEPATETKHEEIPGWSLADVEMMAIDTTQLANLGSRQEEDEEDYDEEG
ncbi:PREDICTED: dr1-associated corepressor homolog isoform X2 [Lupinus angustifolius]|nr:PREDICTED: dr1-associated corepressor homolog isoform X2 [Lupinus angustifolius]XP_019419750.1 PREDICTED: dr1-associated corepressor homolog isoform X2 [Lupinus angustifolius]